MSNEIVIGKMIIINGRGFRVVGPTIDHEQVSILGGFHNEAVSIVWNLGLKEKGLLNPDSSVEIKEGMIFDVVPIEKK